jgi:NAD(P)-dependent dehydrogenase (short-subunit alcohol dehydrogenase family)
MKVPKSAVFALVFAALGFLYVQKTADLDRDYLKSLLKKSKSKSSSGDYPLEGRIAVVTGSTSGLGMAIATELYGFGATVYVVGRNPTKLSNVASTITQTCTQCPGQIVTEKLDTADLVSVKNFSMELSALLGDSNKVDFLVNNAGIHYVSNGDAALEASPQGYDVAFATNYLGHFLLTELLLPMMSDDGRIVQVASTMHMMSDASMLRIQDGEDMPFAAQATRDSWQQESAYGNNKLAQILHSRELQRRLDRKESGVKVVSICPNWVNTNILPDDIGGRFVASQAFSPSAGTLSALYAAFSPDIKGGDYVSNSRVPILEIPGVLRSILKIPGKARMITVNILSMVVLGMQKLFYGATVLESSPESYDKPLQRALFVWSKNAVAEYM